MSNRELREILFRGKRVDNGEWVYVEVLSKTVGQYTGLKDKNGTKIFEGDILKISFGKKFLKAVVKFGYYNQPDKILKSHLGFYFDFVDSESYRKDVGYWIGRTLGEIEVIGNVYDNPELKKKGGGVKMDDVLIYKQDVQKLVCRLNGCVGSKRSFNNCEKRCPDFKAIDELPIVQREQKTGRWIDMDDHVMCSCCGATHYGADKNYCPNCGAKMKSEEIE